MPAPAPWQALRIAFILTHASRLQALDYGDMAALATVCPQLQRLTLGAELVGPVFWPLGSLPCLRSLSLTSEAMIPEDKQDTLESLAYLTQITELVADENFDISMDAMLRHVDGMRSLGSLQLYLRWEYDSQSPAPIDPAPIAACMGHLNSLRSLGSLDLYTPLEFEPFSICSLNPELLGQLTSLRFVPPFAYGHEIPAAQLACLRVASNLASLTLDNALTSDTVIMLASLPKLERLYAAALELDTDLSSSIDCSWMVLTLSVCPSPYVLVRLPNRDRLKLTFGGCSPNESNIESSQAPQGKDRPSVVEWTLEAGMSMDATCRTIQQAARMLVLAGWRRGEIHLIVAWDAAPAYPSAPVLAALAPLSTKRGMSLFLETKHWNAGPDHVAVLAQHLPKLERIAASSRGCNHASFVAALATSFPQLRAPYSMLA